VNSGDVCSCQKAGKVDGISKKSTANKKGHKGQILSLSLSSDVKFLVSIHTCKYLNISHVRAVIFYNTIRSYVDFI